MKTNEIWNAVHQERRNLARILSTLSPAEWETDSLCPGWSVRDVAAHIIDNPQVRARDISGFFRARGNYDRWLLERAQVLGERPVEQILGDFTTFDGSRKKPPVPVAAPLLEVLIHTQDIVQPLGRTHQMPPIAAAEAATAVRRFWPIFRPPAAVRSARLVATDVDWTSGRGATVEGPIQSLLLLASGRPVDRSMLSGPGVQNLP